MSQQTPSLRKEFAKYVSLNILSMIGLSCFIFVDTLCIANGVGSDGLTALNLTLPVYSVLNGLGLMIGMGGATRYSIDSSLLSRRDREPAQASHIFSGSLAAAVILGLIFTLIGLFASSALASLLGARGQVHTEMVRYMQPLLLFSLAFAVNNVIVCYVRNDGDPQTAMAAMITGSMSNIVMDLLFVFGFGWGMAGAAVATGISPLLSIAVASRHFARKGNHLKVFARPPRPMYILKTFTLGVSSLITEISSGLVILLFNFIILGLAGSIGVAAYGVIANIALIVISVYNGVAQGIQPLVSSRYGMGQRDEIQKITSWSLVLCLALGLLFTVGGILFAAPLTGVFNHGANPEFTRLSVEGIRIYFPAFLLMGVNIVTAALCSAVEQPGRSMAVSLGRGVLFPLVFLLMLAPFLGMEGVWLAVPAAELATFFFTALRYDIKLLRI